MLLPMALKAINHVLAGEDWARQRLRAFAGQTLRIEFGRLVAPMVINSDGFLVKPMATEAGTASSGVSITLPIDAPARLILDPASLTGAVHISGPAELAECLSFVFKHLRWDVEHDLAQVVGDIAARRVVDGGMRFARWQAVHLMKLTENVVDYLSTEQRTLVQRADTAGFTDAVSEVRDAVDDLEVRIGRLEKAGKSLQRVTLPS